MRDVLQIKKNNGFDIHLLEYNSTDLLPWLAFAHFDLQSFEHLSMSGVQWYRLRLEC